MTDHEDIKQDATTDSAETAGQKLAAAREDFGISVQEVAENLNLGVSIIRAIETDDYDKLPGSTFVKGYIRAYANLLRLNPDELIMMLDGSPVRIMEIPSGKGIAKFRRRSWTATKKRGFWFKFLVFVLMLLFIVVALFGLSYWFQADLKKFIPSYQFPIPEQNESGSVESGY